MRRSKWFCAMLVLSLAVSGCSAFRTPHQWVTVTTDHPEAEIYVNGIMEGKGRVTVPVKRDETALVVVRKGTTRIQHPITTAYNKTAFIDIIGGFLFLVPFFGLMAPGARSLEERDVRISLME